MTEYITNSYEETLALASKLAKEFESGSVIGFLGGLGAGKTAFTCGFVEGLGIKAEVSSPTFAICNIYKSETECVYHFDMYRIETWDDLLTGGYYESLDSGAYVICEWSENIFAALPENAIIIKIERLGENSRRFCLMTKAEAEVSA